VSSTYIWNLFRQSPSVLAYCEVFHEELAILDADSAHQLGPHNWRSKHPDMAPYFQEFESFLVNPRGVAGYDPSMAFDEYFDSTLSPATARYLQSLVQHAEVQGQIPVLSCTRSLGRVPALVKAFPGYHVVIYRPLWDQWCSYTDQIRHGNPYYLATVRKVLEEGRKHIPFLSTVWDTFPLGEPDAADNNYFCAFSHLGYPSLLYRRQIKLRLIVRRNLCRSR
jgi:hypothetical protein